MVKKVDKTRVILWIPTKVGDNVPFCHSIVTENVWENEILFPNPTTTIKREDNK